MVRSIGARAANSQRGHTMNLSEGGTGCVIPGEWRAGQVVTLELSLPGMDRSIVLSARVCHRDDMYCGLEFLAPSPEAVSLIQAFCRPE
jgi:hypothetical protein